MWVYTVYERTILKTVKIPFLMALAEPKYYERYVSAIEWSSEVQGAGENSANRKIRSASRMRYDRMMRFASIEICFRQMHLIFFTCLFIHQVSRALFVFACSLQSSRREMNYDSYFSFRRKWTLKRVKISSFIRCIRHTHHTHNAK